MNFEKPPKIRELTRAYAAEERIKTAREIGVLRTQYFERIKALEEKIAGLIPQKEEHLLKADQCAVERAQLEQGLMELRASLFSRLFRGDKIQVQGEKLYDIDEKARSYQTKFAEVSDLIDTLEKSRRDSSELAGARNSLEEFYQKQRQLLPDYKKKRKKEMEMVEKRRKENKRASSVEDVIKDHNVFFIHGIHIFYVPGSNSLLESNTDWQTKLKIMIGFDPTIAASTIKKGDNENNFWSQFGVILRKGTIMEAYASDANSVAVDVDSRIIDSEQKKDMAEQVQQAIYSRSYNSAMSYNEFSIDNPEVVGLFIFPEELKSKRGKKYSLPWHRELKDEAENLKMPVIIFNEGNFYSAQFNETDGCYIPSGDPLHPKDILKMQPPVPEETRTRLRDEILMDAPFKIHKLGPKAYEEFSLLKSYSQGRIMFAGLYMGRNRTSVVKKNNEGEESMQIISEFTEPGCVVRILTDEHGWLWQERVETKKGVNSYDRFVLRHEQFKNQSIRVGQNTWMLESAIQGIKDYVKKMEAEIKKLAEKYEGEKDEKNRYFYQNILRRLAAHCQGFADQAEDLSDRMASEAARSIGELVLSSSEMKDLSARRLGSKGEMRITKEDLYHYYEDKKQRKHLLGK